MKKASILILLITLMVMTLSSCFIGSSECKFDNRRVFVHYPWTYINDFSAAASGDTVAAYYTDGDFIFTNDPECVDCYKLVVQ